MLLDPMKTSRAWLFVCVCVCARVRVRACVRASGTSRTRAGTQKKSIRCGSTICCPHRFWPLPKGLKSQSEAKMALFW